MTLQPKYIEIKLTKYRLYLTEKEITELLGKAPEKWAEWIRRGKAINRSVMTRQRANNHVRGGN